MEMDSRPNEAMTIKEVFLRATREGINNLEVEGEMICA